MNRFLQQHAAFVTGVLSGLDRLRLRGTKRLLAHTGGMLNFLFQRGVLLKEFKDYALDATQRIRRGTEALAEAAGQSVRYLTGSRASKEDLVRQLEAKRDREPGLICILSCVEPCWSYQLRRNREKRELELHRGWYKCLHYYHYYRHPKLGLLHLRLQTWFPFAVHVCLNGREWLACQMDAARIGYQRRDNCFAWIEDPAQAQALMEQQLRTTWPRLLDGLVRRCNPADAAIFRQVPVPYYWSVDQSEWATDVMFRSPAALASIYPRLLRHAVHELHSLDVLRFLGRQVPAHNGRYGTFKGEVLSDLKERPEGTRVKHSVNGNSVKMYNKEEWLLRIETTLNDAHDMKVFRPKEGDAHGRKSWRYLRKSVADLHRRAQVSQAANERYLEALAAAADSVPLGSFTDQLCRSVRWKGKRMRALQPLAPADTALLTAVSRGEFTINGFRNRDLRALLYPGTQHPRDQLRRQSAVITRKLRLLRAHGLISKVPHTHRYVLSARGRTAITALLAARKADTAKLLDAA